MSDKTLRAGLIRLAHSHPEFRKDLLPLITACGPEAPMQGKFEEGKPADPTKNMSPEDAAEWKKQTELNKDKFKGASGLPDRAGRNWKEKNDNLGHRWLWDDGTTAFQVVEFMGPGVPLYRLVMTTEVDGHALGPMKWPHQAPEKEKMFGIAAQWAKNIQSFAQAQGGGIDFSQWRKLAGCEKLPEGGMRDNCEKKQEEGEKKEASKKSAGTAIVRRTTSIAVRVITAKPDESDWGRYITGQMSLDFGGNVQPDAVRFAAHVEPDDMGNWTVKSFTTQKSVSGGGAEILLGVLKAALQEAVSTKGESLFGSAF